MGWTWQKNTGEGNSSIDETQAAQRQREEEAREERIAEQGRKLRAQTDRLMQEED